MMLAPLLLTTFVLAIAPDDAALTEARTLMNAGQMDEAAALLQATVEAGGGEATSAGILLSEVQCATGQPEAAVATLDGLGQADDAGVALALGRSYLAWADKLDAEGANQEDVRLTLLDAQSHLERAVDLSTGEGTQPHLELGNVVLYRFGDHVAAMELANDLLAANPNDANMLLLRGCAGVYEYWNAKQGGDLETANVAWQASVDDLKASAKALPRERLEPWGQLVWLYEDKGEAVKAVEAAMAIVDRQDDPNFDTLYRLAKRYSIERQFQASSRALEMMVSLSAREITTRLRAEEDKRGIATELAWSIDPFVQRQDRATARSILKAIVAADPGSPDVLHNYAVMCEETSRFEDALTAYEKLVEIQGDNPRNYNDLGALLHHALNRDLDRAKELYQTCIDMAGEQLLAANLPDARRAELTQARSVAQGSLDQLSPASGGGSLLDGLLDGLSGLELPELPEDDEDGDGDAEADGDSGGGEG